MATVSAGIDKQKQTYYLMKGHKGPLFLRSNQPYLNCTLTIQKTYVCISGFGAESPSDQQLGTVNIYIQSLAGEQMPVSALIVPHIATPEFLSGLCQEYSTSARPCIGTTYYVHQKKGLRSHFKSVLTITGILLKTKSFEAMALQPCNQNLATSFQDHYP